MAIRFIAQIIKPLVESFLSAAIIGMSIRLHPREIKKWVDVTPVRLRLPRLAQEFEGYRIVQISDFHIGTWIIRQRLEEAVNIVNREQPDLVVITGDFVTYKPEKYKADLVAALSKLKPKDGTLAILGNHDHWTDPDIVRSVLRDSGIIDLSNAVHTLQRGEGRFYIAGVDDCLNNLDRLDLVLKKLPHDGAAILLAHEPDFADISAATGRFDLQLSGHTHGGQIRLPGLGAPFLPPYGKKYPMGLYRIGEMYQYTNRGLGTADLAIRLNCQAEITVFTLEASNSSHIHFESVEHHSNQVDSF